MPNANTSLEMLASYVTPVQTQQTQLEIPLGESENASGQKRKRADGETQVPQEKGAHTPQRQRNPPDATPPPRAPLPAYNLPRFNREQSAPPLPSPTNEALKRRKLQSQSQEGQSVQQTEQEEGMAVDDNPPYLPEQANTPTPANKRHWYDDDPANQTDEVQRNSGSNPSLNLRNSERLQKEPSTKTPPTHPTPPIDKYTKGQMPEIHDSDSMMLLAGLDGTQIQDWLDIPTGKVLARPFDTDVNYQPNHKNIAKLLLAAAKEITGATTATVATPMRDRNDARGRGRRHPITFLIHEISKKDTETLLERCVWSSRDITFQVSPVNVKCPDFLFTLTGFSTNKDDHVLTGLTERWNDHATNATIRYLASRTKSPGWNSDDTSEAASTKHPTVGKGKRNRKTSTVASATGAIILGDYAPSHKSQAGTEEAD
ncbi:hypothetical protein EDB86DRAFT_2825261 [Lactarius hatsudake]|nr:hypothetical protein EDB86DRAFT_2825261 [Lactarius hatsudake]